MMSPTPESEKGAADTCDDDGGVTTTDRDSRLTASMAAAPMGVNETTSDVDGSYRSPLTSRWRWWWPMRDDPTGMASFPFLSLLACLSVYLRCSCFLFISYFLSVYTISVRLFAFYDFFL
eukprot:GHVU01035692.1.p2 GENE.GHVU01035692.1~~GHVU01035692.1.p2  ORF type:complete len:120 (-),score=8.47 GHVU01035692.1:158-517(-)